jgi:hypothetical protein
MAKVPKLFRGVTVFRPFILEGKYILIGGAVMPIFTGLIDESFQLEMLETTHGFDPITRLVFLRYLIAGTA